MTAREKIEAQLFEMGISNEVVTKIMDYSIPLINEDRNEREQSKITWDAPAEEYPDGLYSSLFLAYINKHVVEWADKNMPIAWWIPLFSREM